jgi:Spy/CpxP family protein refolding chaperone
MLKLFVQLRIDDMNTRNIKFTGALLLAFLMVTAVEAQRRPGGRGPGPGIAPNGPAFRAAHLDLTEEQQEEISTLRIEHHKEITPLKNKMAELRARERTLLSEEDVDMKAVEKNIDEQTDLLNNIRKLQIGHRLNVKNILNDEQVMKMQQGRRFSHRDGFYGKGNRRGDRGMPMERGYQMKRKRLKGNFPPNDAYRMKMDQETQMNWGSRTTTKI